MNRPAVSVVVHTFNASQTVAEALCSVVRQQTTFPVEIIVWDDASADDTTSIAEDVLSRQDRPWQVIASPSNLYSTGKSPMLRSAARAQGDFLARLDGDDFWCNEFKLQRQWDLFQQHPSAVLSCTGYKVVDASGTPVEVAQLPTPGPIADYQLLLRGNFVCHSSAMYRRQILESLPPTWEDLVIRDYALWGYAAMGTDILVDPMPLAGYRLHPGSAWSARSTEDRIGDEIAAVAWLSENVHDAEQRRAWRMRRIEIQIWGLLRGMPVRASWDSEETVQDMQLLFGRLSNATALIDSLNETLKDLQEANDDLRARLDLFDDETQLLAKQLTEQQDLIESLTQSVSWRLTAPLRGLKSITSNSQRRR